MLTLCADTSGTLLSFTVAENTVEYGLREIYSECAPSGGRINEIFFPCLDGVLANAAVKIGDIDRLVSITGPGSFTGIRIGVAAFAGIAAGLGKEHIGLSALDAAALISNKTNVTVAAGIRANEYAIRSYDFTTGEFSEISMGTPPQPSDTVIVINSRGAANSCGCLSKAVADPRAEGFYRDSAPMYIKRSEAEINFDKKGNIF